MGEETLMATNGGLDFHDNEAVHINGIVKENEILAVDFLEDLDSYWDDINDRLTISRMVSDSLIRGVVNAVESEATEKIAEKELQLSRLRDALLLYHVGAEENETPRSRCVHGEACLDDPDASVERGRNQESLENLEAAAKNQLETLFEELYKTRRYDCMNGTDGNEEILGLGSSPSESGAEKWIGVVKKLDSLKSILGAAFRQMDMESFSLWQHDHDCREEIQSTVVASFVRSLKEEYEQRLQEKNADFYGNDRCSGPDKIKEIIGLRQELELISKSLSGNENGHHPCNGVIEVGEEKNQRRADPLHRKISGGHISSASLWDSNGKHEESVASMPENFDALKHLSRDDLISHFKNEMNQMKREHDYRIQEMTEDYFSLRREYLNLEERGSSSLPLKRDKEFDALSKKIPDVISKLDMILLENEMFVSAEKNNSDLKSRSDLLLLENCHLRDSLTEMKRENNDLSSQVSDASEKMLQLSQAEEKLLQAIRELRSDVEDSRIEAFLCDEVYRCFVGEFVNWIKCVKDEADMEHSITGEVFELICRDIVSQQSSESKHDLEDSCVESLVKEEYCAVLYKEALKEAYEKLEELNMEHIFESKARVSLEMRVSEKEDALRLEFREKERLKQNIHSLESLVEEKEKLVQEAENSLAKESEKLKIALQKICNLQDQIEQQERAILKRKEELELVTAQALEKAKGYEVETYGLRQELALAKEMVVKIENEKTMLLGIKHENEKKLSEKQEEEKKLRKQFESLVVVSSELMKGFNNIEHRVAETTKKTDSRLKGLHDQLSSLSQQADELKGRALMYKQRLEKKHCDLQKAESEVDLLGDEVESLLDLLEKIYIALDHYSPILKHYPGIIDILKLVRRELSGESRRSV